MKTALAIMALGTLLWFQWLRSADESLASSPAAVAGLGGALQTNLPPDHAAITREGWTLQPLAGFSVQGRLLAKTRYSTDAASSLAPFDFALGWGPMADPAVLEKLSISQSRRQYHWRYWGTPPVPEREIIRHSANMHLIPANEAVAAQLTTFEPGSLISLTGMLVEAAHPAGNAPWRSSLTRDDSGQGSCEIIYVTGAGPSSRVDQMK
jgi:hypothetical protein